MGLRTLFARVGNDGMTASERRREAARFEATVGRMPVSPPATMRAKPAPRRPTTHPKTA